jgi:hypothetical protein
MTDRLPAGLEVSALLRQVNQAGGFGMVLAKGEPEAGTIILILCENGRNSRAYERLPNAQGTRLWQCTRREDDGQSVPLADWIARRQAQDPDLWIVELDIANGERFIGLPANS